MSFFNLVNKDIIFSWVPSYIGIRGNEKADFAAMCALVGASYNDFKHCFNIENNS